MATAAFFAPLMETVPFKGLPPWISYLAKDDPLLVLESNEMHINAYFSYYIIFSRFCKGESFDLTPI